MDTKLLFSLILQDQQLLLLFGEIKGGSQDIGMIAIWNSFITFGELPKSCRVGGLAIDE